MPALGVNVAIIHEGQILLAKREDFEVWCLPGGEVDPGESVAQAAVREAFEETGLEVVLDRLVGIYSRPQGGAFTGHIVLFAGRPVAGSLHPQPAEVIDLRYFKPNELPSDLIAWHKRRILDAFQQPGGGVAWRYDRAWLLEPEVIPADLYTLRDRSGLSRSEFYARHFNQPGKVGEMDEIASPAGARVEPQAHEVAGQNVGGPELGVSVAILQAGKLLLTQREDYEIWCLPGGGVELGETLVQAAMRETYEEVGLEVKLTRLVGVYTDPRWFNHGLHVVLFAAQVIGGKLAPQAGEVLAARFFGLDELPEALMFGTRQRAEHALQGVGGGVAWTQYSPRPLLPPLTRQEIYAMRDLSGLSRAEFYRRNFGDFDPGSETLEVGPHDAKNH